MKTILITGIGGLTPDRLRVLSVKTTLAII